MPPSQLPIQIDGGLDIVEASNYSQVVDSLNVDLNSLMAPYTGLALVYRLEFIAEHCLSLRIPALKMAVEYIKKNTYNCKDYARLSKKLADYCLAAGERPPAMDLAWLEANSKLASSKLERIENDLKNYQSNCVRESIRRGQDELGDHYLNCGELELAFSAYSKSRDYARTPKNTIIQCLNMIRVSILLNRWPAVSNHVIKAEGQNLNDAVASPTVATKLCCASGLYGLSTRNFKKAATSFLNSNYDHFSLTSNDTSQATFDILAPTNIAVYGGICALATFSRKDLSTKVLNSSFRQFLESEPQVREALQAFYESKYAKCLQILANIKKLLLIDMYLAPHVDILYRAIRNKALVQYFEPYSVAHMDQMAKAFNTSLHELETEMINLICEGQISARIDSHKKILYAKDIDPRKMIFERAMNVGKTWQRQTRALISKTAIVNAGLV